MGSKETAIGFDVGGHSIKAALVDRNGALLATTTHSTGRSTTAAEFAAALVDLRDQLLRGGRPRPCYGMGIAGVLDRGGELRGSPNLPALVGCRVAGLAADALGTPVEVDNDANCAALAEAWGGAASGERDFLLLTLGTGLGSGLVLSGRVYQGATGHGCELGHSVIVRNGRLCGCGNHGCLEAYASETALRAMLAEEPAEVQHAVQAEQENADVGTAHAIFSMAEGGHAVARRLASTFLGALGTGVASALNVLDLELVVLAGGISPGVLARIEDLRSAMASSLFARSIDEVRIVGASKGPFAGAIGAARLGLLACENDPAAR